MPPRIGGAPTDQDCQDPAGFRLGPSAVAGIVIHGGRHVVGLDAAAWPAVEQRPRDRNPSAQGAM